MEKVVIEIETVNAAFDDYLEGELNRILTKLGEQIERGERPTILLDINGNKVGTVTYE